ncbi:putative membrane fusion protein (MFP) component of efflux pump, membrane anchor protein YbhG [Rhodovulum sp. P5]|uniref:HlyD family secretion protein n=1 Tax=Rhodovulum sp. P5 TaxID=1564506 RepID=UPI0009C2E6D3|nr:HlyD family efflux transporter periplasmic adaptor subunit [Rhodovulum sp. P5]ARE41734.1 putative membrane fusion protein (MFP) component of efflux pump, membrane anchor protein YbhG [Rhodovulum sp. P5]
MTGFICALPLAASLFNACAAPPPFATGYVEGEFTLVAPVAVAQIRAVHVARGDRIAADTVMVEMERRDAEIALEKAKAALDQAQSHLADLKEGKRPEEIEVIEATLASAEAQAREAARNRDRLISLAARGVVNEAQRDDAVTAAEVAEAQVAQVRADLAVARLPARPQAIAEAEAAVEVARAAHASAEWNLDQRRLSLPEPVTVFDVIRTPGEIAGPSAPVLSVLGEDAVKLRLYIPETAFSTLATGDDLSVRCDGCAPGLTARVTYIANEAEFTPPVIYSLENRQKLVYLVEARPDPGSGLKPGQIVDVVRPGE